MNCARAGVPMFLCPLCDEEEEDGVTGGDGDEDSHSGFVLERFVDGDGVRSEGRLPDKGT
jgi:hypothetical protein